MPTDALLACLLLAALPALPELRLEAALPIDGPPGLEPSGLTLHDGALLMVSDKHDDFVYLLELEGERALARPWLPLPRPDRMTGDHLDLEAITSGPGGALLLASEAESRVLRLDHALTAAWSTPDLRPRVAASGLLGRDNAGLEGIAVDGDGKLYLAAEREPRGILEVATGADGELAVRATRCEPTRLPLPAPRRADFADLALDGEALWALERNPEAVCRLDPAAGFAETDCFGFGATVRAASLRYEDETYGTAEGLALDPTHVYLVLDNNRMARAAAPGDCRPLLLVFTRPPGMR